MAETQPAEHTIVVPPSVPMVALLGSGDEYLRVIERAFPDVDFLGRGNEVKVQGPQPEVALIERLFDELVVVVRTGAPLSADSVRRSIDMLRADTLTRPADVLTADILSNRGRAIRPKTLNQKRYVDAIDRHTITFGIGPAGTGKTYLAVAKAVQALQTKQVNRIILTRPAVEAGERLGFLPGTLYEKIDPYLRPLYDALRDMLDPDLVPKLLTDGVIEVAPLAYMRGRAQDVNSKVLTPGGWRPIGQLEVGDLVVGSDGVPTPVLGVFPQGRKEIFRVSTQDGASTLASGDHLWAVSTRDDVRRGKPHRVLKTMEMIGNLRAAHYHRYELPVLSAPAEFYPTQVPMDPYALGLMLGDGCLSGSQRTPSFTTADVELGERLAVGLPGIRLRHTDRFNHLVLRDREQTDVLTRTNPLVAVARELGLWGTKSSTKFVPELYLYNSAEVRIGILQGLLDTDGGPVTQANRTCRVQYCTTSTRLRDDVVFLVRSLGGVAYWRTRVAEGRKPGLANGRPVPYNHDAYVVDIRLPAGIEPFRLERKADKYREFGGGGRPMRFIHSIEPAGTAECVCIQVGAVDSLYVTEDFLLTHNTLSDSFIILDEAQNTSAEQMKMFLTRLGFGSKIVVTGDVTQVDLPSGTSSGLRIIQQILEGVGDVSFNWLQSTDVVRHRLVGDIVEAYGRWDAEQPQTQNANRGRGRR
ncbi:PhoH family protein [Sporichthya sp.]|uniref:PhoH family protein n=1 Tax=Sporichthya sp. TaxID=65475 RepID=UPI0025DE3F56|nr:PhoH family protein [Sporichthya sp.]